ncbi:hypothetical protein NDN16_20660 [Aureimonas altamirensis]|uniref:hypothetical protein n=1 Tax=Aureimonas altamirensis TaxID=370622 RepID=UPI0020366905|nr:hypothetical protein [Aureimonas altamirensis]MCM2506070.1 hypothetical protein [Aureimonas altamirensis]
MFDGEIFGKTILEAVTKAIDKATKPLLARIDELEKQSAERNSVASVHITRDGDLVATYSNGAEKNLGPVIGKDGDPGKDGKDGFDLTAFDIQLAEDGRTLEFTFEDEQHKAMSSFVLPVPLYRGVWEQKAYQRGDTVTYSGSTFIALKDTGEKPGTSDWQLAVKRGRDGRGADGVSIR